MGRTVINVRDESSIQVSDKYWWVDERRGTLAWEKLHKHGDWHETSDWKEQPNGLGFTKICQEPHCELYDQEVEFESIKEGLDLGQDEFRGGDR